MIFQVFYRRALRTLQKHIRNIFLFFQVNLIPTIFYRIKNITIKYYHAHLHIAVSLRYIRNSIKRRTNIRFIKKILKSRRKKNVSYKVSNIINLVLFHQFLFYMYKYPMKTSKAIRICHLL